jgi:hypothetical protein
MAAMHFYGDNEYYAPLVGELKKAVVEAERQAAEHARARLAELEEEHGAYTLAWAKASELQQTVLKKEIDRLEAEIGLWKPRTVSISQRLESVSAARLKVRAERGKLLAEWPMLECREKGEALRRLFKKVTLFWEKRFHPALKKPTRPRKTSRPGRYSYYLQRDRIRWALATSDLENSW